MLENLLPVNSISVIRGVSKTLQVRVTSAPGEHSGPPESYGNPNDFPRPHGKPVDLTGSRMIFSVKEFLEAPQPLIQKDSNNASEILFTNALCGIAQIYLVPQDTQFLDPLDFIYDVWLILPSGARYAVIPPSILQVKSGVTFVP